MREYNYSFVSRTHWPEDVSILGCEDVRIPTSAHKLGIWGCEDASIQASIHEPEDMRMWGYKNTRIQASTHEPEDIRMHDCKQGYMKLKIWGCKDVRIPTRIWWQLKRLCAEPHPVSEPHISQGYVIKGSCNIIDKSPSREAICQVWLP